MSDEQAITETSPSETEGQVVTTANNGESTSGSPANEQNVPQQVKAPADMPVSSTPAFDAKTSYDTLQKSYGELRREFTRRTQHESELQKKLDSLASTLAKATETPIDLQQFLKDLQTQPDKALEPLLMKHTEGIKATYDQKMADMSNKLSLSEFRSERLARVVDGENYPDFKKLEPLMKQLADDENTPLDFNREPGEIIDALYKLARTLSMESAIQEAKSLGKKEAETQLAKEASTSVVTGGKSGVPTSPSEIKDINALRKYFVSQIGEAE